MPYRSLEDCLLDLEKNGQLIRIKEEVDPYLEMAAIHLRVHEAGGPALLFENVKGSKFRAASNIFGTLERSEFIFRVLVADCVKAMRDDTADINTRKNCTSLLPCMVVFIIQNIEYESVERSPKTFLCY